MDRRKKLGEVNLPWPQYKIQIDGCERRKTENLATGEIRSVIVKVSQASLQDLLATGPTTTDNGKLVINEEQWRGKEDLVEP